jgi:hypothetical protein
MIIDQSVRIPHVLLRVYGDTVAAHRAERSKAWTLFARLDAGIVASNPTQGMDDWCVYVFILCLGSGFATSWSLAQGVLPSVKNDYGTE